MVEVRPIQPLATPRTGQPGDEAQMRAAAMDLEASFLAEMLTCAGLGKSSDMFGGGVGEEQFSSFLVQEQAKQMARAGGIGLAETIFNALQKGATHG